MRKSLLLIVALEALAALQIAYYFPRLPETVASHFAAAGTANSWESKQMFLEFYVIVLIGIAAVYFVVPRLLFALPNEMINLPNKAYWLAPQRRTQTLEQFSDWFAIFGAATLALVIAVFQLVIQANANPSASFSTPIAVTLLALYFAFIALWAVLMFVRFRRPQGG